MTPKDPDKNKTAETLANEELDLDFSDFAPEENAQQGTENDFSGTQKFDSSKIGSDTKASDEATKPDDDIDPQAFAAFNRQLDAALQEAREREEDEKPNIDLDFESDLTEIDGAPNPVLSTIRSKGPMATKEPEPTQTDISFDADASADTVHLSETVATMAAAGRSGKPQQPMDLSETAILDHTKNKQKAKTTQTDKKVEQTQILDNPADIAKKAGSGKPAATKSTPWLTLIFALVALALAGFAIWQNLQTQAQLEPIRQQNQAAQSATQNAAQDRKNEQENLLQLEASVNELASQLQNISDENYATSANSELREQIADLSRRLAQLEQTSGKKANPAKPTAKTKPPVTTTAQTQQTDWVVNLASLTSNEAAKSMLQRLKKSENSVELDTVMLNGKQYYRLVLSGFKDRASAAKKAKAMREKGYRGSWVASR